MYTSATTRRVGAATPLRRTQKSRVHRLIGSRKASPQLQGGTGVRVFSRETGSAAEGGGQGGGLWSNVKARSRLSGLARGVPSASSVAGAVALIPVVGGVWFVSVFALRQRLCEHHLQQVCGMRLLIAQLATFNKAFAEIRMRNAEMMRGHLYVLSCEVGRGVGG